MLTIDDLNNINGKKVFVRVDFNVPIENGLITDDNRIIQALPTIIKLINENAKIILLSHLGKINFKCSNEEIEKQKKKNDLKIISNKLSELLKKKVFFVENTRGNNVTNAINSLCNGDVLLLQNTRYEPGETKNQKELAEYWANMADIYILEAFGSAHRIHASTYGITEILKNKNKPVAIGYLVKKEIDNLMKCVNIEKKNRPYIAILGGLKVSDKIKVINYLIEKCDKIIIGGAMAYTFQKALGHNITTLVEFDQIDYAKSCLKKAKDKIILPIDVVVTDSFKNWHDKKTVDLDHIPNNYEGMDIGPLTQKLFAKELSTAKTIFWNGPMGAFEYEDFKNGTISICEAISKLKNTISICGGGDSAAAVKKFGYKKSFSFISTGGGASLELIENNGHLPCIDIINS